MKVENLKVVYRTLKGDAQAIDDVSFEVADGEIMGLAGESGSGKTTLSMALIRMDSRMRYVSGSVELDGRRLPVDDNAAMNDFRFKEISIVPQYAMSAMNPIRRIGQMIKELLSSRGIKFDTVKDELDRRLELVGLPLDVLNRYPIELSGGMKQRMVLVLSTLLNPSLLIADEVTSALDVSTQRAVATTLMQFRDRGFVKSMMVVTHDLSLVYQIADTILVMYAGRLAEKADAETIVNEPLHPYSKMLVSSLPEIGAEYSDQRLEGIPGSPPQLIDPAPGCRFRDRCPLASSECDKEPDWVEIKPAHWVACWKVQ